MNWLEKLERKSKFRGINNITIYAVACTMIGYVLMYASTMGSGLASVIVNMVAFDAGSILRGQIWRLFTWILIPQGSLSFWNLLFMFCLFMLGRSLEQGLGSFKMTVYFAGGWLLSTLGGLLIYIIFRLPVYMTPYYILFSLYLMLGLFMPEAEMRLYFVLPIKMKWLVIVYFIMLAYEVFSYFRMGVAAGIMMGAEIIFAIINLLVFVSSCKNQLSLKARRKQQQRQQEYRRQMDVGPRPGAVITHHKCCICGRTDADSPELTFRYCSKCAGNREYCQEHLFTHQHFTGV